MANTLVRDPAAFERDFSKAMVRRLMWPPGYSGIIYPDPEVDALEHVRAWRRYDAAQKFAGLGGIV